MANVSVSADMTVSLQLEKALKVSDETAEKIFRRTISKPSPAIDGVLTKFVKAMDDYILYSKTRKADFYDDSIIAFAKIPVLDKIKLTEGLVALVGLLKKITHVICNNFPNLHVPSVEVIEKMVQLLQSLKNINKTETRYQSITYITHESKKVHVIKDQRPFLASLKMRVQKQLEKSRQCMISKPFETELREDISKTLKKSYPKHELYLFGSRASGQSLDDSDFDFYCDITGNKYSTAMTHGDQEDCVTRVATLLKSEPNMFVDVTPVLSAKVPIVQLVHKQSKRDCDISFKDGTAVENTKLLKVYLDLDLRVRWVLTAVKLWATDNEIKDTEFFRSHGLSWFVLFYLMKNKLVPPFEELQKNCEPKNFNGWNASFTSPKNWKPECQTTGWELFKGFFSWIITANLNKVCLSPYTGKAIPKESLLDVLKSCKGINMNENSGLCIHDAIEHSQNIVSNVKDIVYKNFIDLCKKTSAILKNIP